MPIRPAGTSCKGPNQFFDCIAAVVVAYRLCGIAGGSTEPRHSPHYAVMLATRPSAKIAQPNGPKEIYLTVSRGEGKGKNLMQTARDNESGLRAPIPGRRESSHVQLLDRFFRRWPG